MEMRIEKNELPRMLTTMEAAAALKRRPATLRLWACRGDGPISPIRLNRRGGPLLWREADILALLSGDAAEQ